LVSDPEFFAPNMAIAPDLQWNTEPRKGVDSAAVRILAETGLVGFALTYYPVVIFLRSARTLSRLPAFHAITIMSLGLLFTQMFNSGYRDLVLFVFPLIVFGLAGDVRVLAADSASPHKTAAPVGPLSSARLRLQGSASR
jgi:hypothetical protein